MRIVIAGGHGQIARRVSRLLSARGDQAVGIIRNPDHADDLRADGAEPLVLDLEQTSPAELAERLSGADAVIFAAGAGPNSGVERKDTVDRGSAALLADAAEQAGVRRYLMVSAMGTDAADPDSDEVFQVYLRAKAAADDDLRGRDLDWTVVRPGGLTDDPGTGRIRVGRLEPGTVSRDDVALVLVDCLDRPATAGHTFDLLSGVDPVPDALDRLGSGAARG